MDTPSIQPPVASPTAVATPVSIVAAPDGTPAAPTHQQHASRWHFVLSMLEGMLALGASPAVMELLPAKYQGYIAAASVVEQVVTHAGAASEAITSG